MMQLQAKKSQGLLATLEDTRGKKGFYPEPQSKQSPYDSLISDTSGRRIVRDSISGFRQPLYDNLAMTVPGR